MQRQVWHSTKLSFTIYWGLLWICYCSLMLLKTKRLHMLILLTSSQHLHLNPQCNDTHTNTRTPRQTDQPPLHTQKSNSLLLKLQQDTPLAIRSQRSFSSGPSSFRPAGACMYTQEQCLLNIKNLCMYVGCNVQSAPHAPNFFFVNEMRSRMVTRWGMKAAAGRDLLNKIWCTCVLQITVWALHHTAPQQRCKRD